MKEKTAIIIGAGLAGLATGIYAQINGYKTHIFEHAPRPGGVAATWKRHGYTIDGGIHFYMGFKPGQPMHALYQELGIDQPDQYQEMDIYGRFVDPIKNIRIDLTQDLNRLSSDLKAIAPDDSAFIDRFIIGIKAFKGGNFMASMAKPPELTRPWDIGKMLWSIRKILRYYSGAYAQPINRHTQTIKSQTLKEFIEHIFLPDVPVWFVLFTLGMFSSGNMALRRDGSAGFVRALEQRYLSLGGQVTYRTRVEKIITRKDRAVGVELKDGEKELAGMVVSAGDGHATVFDLLGGRYVDANIKKRYQEWPLFPSVVLASYGVTRTFDKDPWNIVLKSPTLIPTGFMMDNWMPVRIFNYGDGFSPPGKTVVQVMISSQWDPWHTLRRNEDAYRKEKEALSRQVLESLGHIWPGLDKDVEMTDVATPHTWWRYTLNRKGAFEGFAVTHTAINTKIYRTLPGLDNFYLAGQWNSPGGGGLPTFMTGRHAVILMCKHTGRKFTTVS